MVEEYQEGRGGLAVPMRVLSGRLRMALELMGTNPCPYNHVDYMLTPCGFYCYTCMVGFSEQ